MISCSNYSEAVEEVDLYFDYYNRYNQSYEVFKNTDKNSNEYSNVKGDAVHYLIICNIRKDDILEFYIKFNEKKRENLIDYISNCEYINYGAANKLLEAIIAVPELTHE